MASSLIVMRAIETEEPEDYTDPNEVVGLACGKCGSEDVREHDQAVRWNFIEIIDGKLSVSQGQATFETEGFICGSCQSELRVHGRDQDVYDLLTYW
jgi:hypothetical protein